MSIKQRMETTEMVREAAAGKSGAFRTLVSRYQDMAVGYGFSILGDFHLAEDAAQEAFLNAYQELDQLQKPEAFPSWFRQIVFKHCDRFTRRKRVDTVSLDHTTDAAASVSDPEDVMKNIETTDLVYKVLQDETLTEHHRQVITLFYISDYSQKEIATFLGVPVTTVQKRLVDARKRLKKRMLDMFRDDLQSNAPSRDDSFMNRFEQAIQGSDLEKLKALIEKDPGVVNRECTWFARKYNNHPLAYAANFGKVEVMKVLIEAGADVNVNTPYGNPMSRAMGRGDLEAMDLLYEHGATFDMDGALMLACEAQAPDTLRWLLDKGANPNYYHEGWGCSVLMANVQTYTRSDRLPDCINALIDAGAEYEDGPIMDILRGRPDLLAARLADDPELVHRHFDFDYGDFLTLRGSTLLHIAVEYYVRSCVDVLLEHGADINAPALIGKNGVGGQTPIYHIIGRSTWGGFELFEYLLEKEPDLSVKARIQENPSDNGKIMDCMHKGKDHYFEEVRGLTPLGYALRYEHEPEWRSAAQEATKLRSLEAPED